MKILSTMLTFLVHIIIIISHAAGSVGSVKESSDGNLLDLPWLAELCCASPADPHHQEGDGNDRGSAGFWEEPSDSGQTHTPPCLFRNSTSTPGPPQETEARGATCWDILCRVDETGEHLICDLNHSVTSTSSSSQTSLEVSLHCLVTQPDREVHTTHGTERMNCVGEDSITCSVAFHTLSGVAVVTANVSSPPAGPSVMLSILLRLGPPLKLTHTQTQDGELVLSWSYPIPHPNASTVPLNYEVRFNTSQNMSDPNWKHLKVARNHWVSLTGLRPGLTYHVQVRYYHPALPHLLSDWSQPHYIYLENVTYVPERVVASIGDGVTLYCVFNNHRVNARMAVWLQNDDVVPQRQYTAVNDRVSKITVGPSEQRLYDTLKCCQPSGEKYICNYRYATIFIKDPVIDISCVTNGDLDAMTCSWNSTQIQLNFLSMVADLSCDAMREAERLGESVTVVRQTKCVSSGGRKLKSCTLQPIRVTSCYKLWMEAKTDNGTRSLPVYITPIDHVKPQPPSGLSAESLSSGVLKLLWEAPGLQLNGLLYQVRYALSTGKAKPSWKVLESQSELLADVPEPDVCAVYNVQVRCIYVNSTGTWSDWSDSVFTMPHNSRAPDQGPDFWRVFQEDPAKAHTNVTLLFKYFTIVEPTYCVEGLVVQHQASGGVVTEEHIGRVSTYSFEWKDEVHFVTVKAQNSQGISTGNTNMTLNRHLKGQCMQSFSASRLNSSCVVLSWSLLTGRSVPSSLVVEWWGQRYQEGQGEPSEGRKRWTRLPPEQLLYLHGSFYGFEEYVFILYPVFVDGEGEPMYTKVFREDDTGPAAFILLIIIAILSVVLFVTLVISQNHMKTFIWKDVPNPYNCSWAQGMDFKKAETMEQLFRYPEGLPAWPLLLASETISQAAIIEKNDPTAPDKERVLKPAIDSSPLQEDETPKPPEHPRLPEVSAHLQEDETPKPPEHPRLPEVSAQLSVIYSTVLPSNDRHHPFKQAASLSSSSDDGNFSANNSDISDSFPGGLWELENSLAGESDMDPQIFSYHTVALYSETLGPEDVALTVVSGGGRGGVDAKDQYHAGMECLKDWVQEEEGAVLPKDGVVLGKEGFSVEYDCLLGGQEALFSVPSEEVMAVGMGIRSDPLYLPQFHTSPSKLLKAQDSAPRL
ncbi:leptin receptor [Esox lucius]|uniref:leptin receptor n=1 Tax=Esox lucius TaxID=8010 RepID=UPI00147786ED|nr:leptin receptor [Esox lucius]